MSKQHVTLKTTSQIFMRVRAWISAAQSICNACMMLGKKEEFNLTQ